MPKEIAYFKQRGLKISAIEAGETNSAAVAENRLLVWGCGMHGRLGTGRTDNSLLPS